MASSIRIRQFGERIDLIGELVESVRRQSFHAVSVRILTQTSNDRP